MYYLCAALAQYLVESPTVEMYIVGELLNVLLAKHESSCDCLVNEIVFNTGLPSYHLNEKCCLLVSSVAVDRILQFYKGILIFQHSCEALY